MARQSLDSSSERPAAKGKEAPASDPAAAKKAALAIGAILVAILLIAWSMGYWPFDGPPMRNGKPIPATGDVLTPEAQKQIEERKRLEALPEGNPQKPTTVGG
ncbi:MAG: hypothetical protein AABZ53_08820 [Planctomycetota bacterium]